MCIPAVIEYIYENYICNKIKTNSGFIHFLNYIQNENNFRHMFIISMRQLISYIIISKDVKKMLQCEPKDVKKQTTCFFQEFLGNTDANMVKRNSLPIPVFASSVFFFPLTVHENVGLRMEFYGCKGGIYSVRLV